MHVNKLVSITTHIRRKKTLFKEKPTHTQKKLTESSNCQISYTEWFNENANFHVGMKFAKQNSVNYSMRYLNKQTKNMTKKKLTKISDKKINKYWNWCLRWYCISEHLYFDDSIVLSFSYVFSIK